MIGILKNRVNPIPFTDIIVNLFKRPNLAQFFFFLCSSHYLRILNAVFWLTLTQNSSIE